MNNYFDFESSIEKLDDKIKSLEKSDIKDIETIEKYKKNKIQLFEQLYNQLTPWQKVQVARHPNRPHAADYIENIFYDYIASKDE